jgi:hypothetical protein
MHDYNCCETLAAKKNHSILTTIILSLIATLILLQACTNAAAQTEASFTSADRFSIPSLGGEIGFASNGTYANATLTNNTWRFTGLKLDRSQQLGNLTVSAKNSTITITSYRAGSNISNTTARYAWLRYVATGQGQQTVSLGIAAGEGQLGLHPDWSVVVNNVWLGEGEGWAIAPDGTVTVTGAVGNVSIARYSFGSNGDTSNLPFYERHSVTITTVAIVAATVAIATLIKARNNRNKPAKAMPETAGEEEPT